MPVPMLATKAYAPGGWRYERIEGASHWLQLHPCRRGIILDGKRNVAYSATAENSPSAQTVRLSFAPFRQEPQRLVHDFGHAPPLQLPG